MASADAKMKQRRTQVAQAASLERSLARRKDDIQALQGFLRGIERRTIRRAAGMDRLAERAGMQERKVRGGVEDGIHKLTEEIAKLPRSGRALRRLQRDEVRGFLAVIKKLTRRQGRLEFLLADEITWRRQIQQKLKRSDTIVPLLHAGNLDRLEELLAQRRGKGGANRHAQMLGRLRAEKHPYSKEHYAALGRKGGPRRWASRTKEQANGDHERATGT